METILEGTILSIHKNSLRVKFKIDNPISSVKFGEIIDISDDNRHLVYVGKLLMTTFIHTLNLVNIFLAIFSNYIGIIIIILLLPHAPLGCTFTK